MKFVSIEGFIMITAKVYSEIPARNYLNIFLNDLTIYI